MTERPIQTLPHLVRLAAAVVLHDRVRLRDFARAHSGHAGDLGLREAILQCHLFCGFPRMIAALDELRQAGLSLTSPEAVRGGDHGEDPGAVRERGAGLFDTIYGSAAGTVREHLIALDPAFADWVADHAYGRVLSRPGLDAASRELVAVACLAATGHDRQLASHARGAVRCGADPGDANRALDAIADAIPADRLQRARDVVARFARPE